VRPGAGRRSAEEAAAAAGTDWVVMVDDRGMLRGWAWLGDVTTSVDDAPLHPFTVRLRATDSLRTALDAMVTSHTGVAVRVRATGDGDHYEGILTQELLTEELV
jgi:osmoprotectant transport system ATP-binding protein